MGTWLVNPSRQSRPQVRMQARGSRNLLLAAWDILSPVAVRAGQNYMLHWLERQFRTTGVDRTGLAPPNGERGASMGQVER